MSKENQFFEKSGNAKERRKNMSKKIENQEVSEVSEVSEVELLKKQIEELKAMIQNQNQSVQTTREKKVYGLAIGKRLESSQKSANHIHLNTIMDSIINLIEHGITSATSDQIMINASELGLFEKKPSTQGIGPIFAWWRKILKDQGFISY